MLTRAWILETLMRLPVWAWPVYLVEVFRFERYYRAFRAANPVGMLGVGVRPDGRLVITLQARGDAKTPPHWSDHAPRAPWERLAPARAFGPDAAIPELYWNHTVISLVSYPALTPLRALRPDPG